MSGLPPTSPGIRLGDLPPTSGASQMDAPYGGFSGSNTGSAMSVTTVGSMGTSGSNTKGFTFNASGRVKEEKEVMVAVGDGAGVVAPMSAASVVAAKSGYAGGYVWLIWAFVFFIFFVLILMAIFWWAEPSWAMESGSDGKPCMNKRWAGAYAVGIALFIVILFVAVWCCCAC